jgi:shikimate kinase
MAAPAGIGVHDMTASRVILTGFMGSGKTTVGPLVAEQLGFQFVDMDERVAQAAGRPVEALFIERGETVFRALETAVLSQLIEDGDMVIATGGGALASEATMSMAKDGGIVVYLRASAETLAARLDADVSRPLLLGDDGGILHGARLYERVTTLLAKRRPFYEQADVVVDVDGATPPDIALDIVSALMRQPGAVSGER